MREKREKLPVLIPFQTEQFKPRELEAAPPSSLPDRPAKLDVTKLGLMSKAAGVFSEGVFEKPVPQRVEVQDAEPVTQELLVEQIESAYNGYQAVLEGLGGDYIVATPETVASELAEFLTPDVVDYLTRVQEADPTTSFTLVATPNVPATVDGILNAAKDFGNGQPYATYVVDELYTQYYDEELSGFDSDNENKNAVRFSIIPSNPTPNMGNTVAEHQAALALLQAENPRLKVPSVLDAITLWYTLRAQGNDLVGANMIDLTTIAHFDLPEELYKGSECFPVTRVRNDRGLPTASYGFAEGKSKARIVIG